MTPQGHVIAASQAQQQTVAPGGGGAQSQVAGASGAGAAQLSSPPSAPGPGQPPAIHVRGGTTYFHPNIQPQPPQADGRSPGRRLKEPIPIVQPVAGQVRPRRAHVRSCLKFA